MSDSTNVVWILFCVAYTVLLLSLLWTGKIVNGRPWGISLPKWEKPYWTREDDPTGYWGGIVIHSAAVAVCWALYFCDGLKYFIK